MFTDNELGIEQDLPERTKTRIRKAVNDVKYQNPDMSRSCAYMLSCDLQIVFAQGMSQGCIKSADAMRKTLLGVV